MTQAQIESDVAIHWQFLDEKDDPGWRARRCLYAYLAPDRHEILYIGKAWGVTVRGRWNRPAKEPFWMDLEKQRGIFEHYVLLGEPRLNYAGRFSSQLLTDIESLLIAAEQPWGNIQSRNTRISRPGLAVKCSGKWPRRARVYVDNA